MKRIEYEQRRHDAIARHTGDQYGYYGEMMDVDYDYIASLEARIAELEKLAVVWEKCESREQIDHSRRYCVICDRGELWICYLPAPPEEK